MHWTTRTVLVIAIGFGGTLSTGWLPVFADTWQMQSDFAWAIMWTRRSGPCGASVHIGRSAFVDWYAMEAFRAGDGNYAGGPPPERVMTQQAERIALERLSALLDAARVGEDLTAIGSVQTSGWPARCALAESRFDKSGGTSVSGGVALPQRLAMLPSGVRPPKMLPWHPIWRGLLVNLMFWSVLLPGAGLF